MYYGVYYGYAQIGVAIKDIGDTEACYYVLNCIDLEYVDEFRKQIISIEEFEAFRNEHIRYCVAFLYDEGSVI